jgi:hypothetical protein
VGGLSTRGLWMGKKHLGDGVIQRREIIRAANITLEG